MLPSVCKLRLYLTILVHLFGISHISYANPSLHWSTPYSSNGPIYSSPAIANDGTVYIGSNDKKLHAINANGTPKWTFNAGDWVDSTPTIGPDGIIYVGSWDNQLYAINPSDGTKLWDFNTSSNIIASPSVAVDGRIYFGSKDEFFYALESNGSLAWQIYIGNPISSSAALGQDGTIYFGDENGTFHALNQDGTTKWTYAVDEVADTNKSILSSPAINLSGNIFFGSGNGYCYSIADNGSSASLNWKFQTSDRVDASPVLGTNNEVFFISRDGYLRSIDTSTGISNWEGFVGDVFYSSPVVDSNGRVYVIGYTGAGENHLFAYDSDGSKAWDTNSSSSPLTIGGLVDSSLALDASGNLFFGCYDHKVYAVNVGSGLADTAWPEFQRIGSRTGAWPSFSVNIIIEPEGAGEVNGTGIYNQGATATLTVTSNSNNGYFFGYWSNGQTGGSNPLSLEMNSNLNLTANFGRHAYSLTVNAGTGGTATGAGNIPHGHLGTITATPEEGYSFAGWSGDGITDPTASTTTINMIQARTVTANFALNTYSVNVIIDPNGAGSVNGTGTYNHGDTVTLSVISNTEDGYNFDYWSGSTQGGENPLTFEINSDMNLTAIFGLSAYPLTVNSGNGGTATGSGNIPHGNLRTITATPEEGYSFAGWIGSGIADPSALSTTVNMNQDRNISAAFSLNSYMLTLNSGTGGSISGEGNFTHGANVSILASPSEGFSFAHWIGEGIANLTAPSTTVNMNQDRNISAAFSLNAYMLTLHSGTGGSISGEGNFTHGTNASILASPDAGYSFTTWTGEGVADTSVLSTTVNMIQGRTVSASFSLNSYSLLLNAEENGTAVGAGVFPYSSLAPINASPPTGYIFVEWIGDGVAEQNKSSTTVLMNQDRNITARFKEEAENFNYLEISSSPSNAGTSSGSGSYSSEVNASISAVPLSGFLFSSWVGNGLNDPLSQSTTVNMEEDRNVTALFSQKSYNLTLLSGAGGTISGSGTYVHGSSPVIVASPAEGYYFVGWKGSGTWEPSSSSTTVNMTQTRSISALFSINSYDLTLSSNSGGTLEGEGSYTFNSLTSISANPVEGYSFSSWIGEGVTNSLAQNTSVTMNQDRNISAAFSINSYDLTLSSNTGGSVEGTGSYIFNSLVSISANPVHGYSFSSWSGDGVTNPLTQNTSVNMNQDRNVSALFNRILLKSILITENQENNWYKSNWFGIFYQSETGWCYHTELGWLFPDTIQNDSFWAWSPKLEWMWINSSTYTNSFAWMAKETNWIYFDFQNDFDNKIYSYQNGSWTNYSRD